MNKAAIYTTTGGVQIPGHVVGGPYPDGQVYMTFTGGGQGDVPSEQVEYIEDKDKPRAGMETK